MSGAKRKAVVQGYPSGLAGADNPFPTVRSAAQAIETRSGSSRSAPGATEAGLPSAYAAPEMSPREDQMLGYRMQFMKPWDNAARWLEATASRLGVPTQALNDAFGMPSAEEAADAHAAYVRAREREGIHPGGAGMFVGGAAANLPLMVANPVAALLAGEALNSDRASPEGAVLDQLFNAGRRRR